MPLILDPSVWKRCSVRRSRGRHRLHCRQPRRRDESGKHDCGQPPLAPARSPASPSGTRPFRRKTCASAESHERHRQTNGKQGESLRRKAFGRLQHTQPCNGVQAAPETACRLRLRSVTAQFNRRRNLRGSRAAPTSHSAHRRSHRPEIHKARIRATRVDNRAAPAPPHGTGIPHNYIAPTAEYGHFESPRDYRCERNVKASQVPRNVSGLRESVVPGV